ncbi:MAG: methyltransferase domain-containing protein [Bryobacteraceae bacterium]
MSEPTSGLVNDPAFAARIQKYVAELSRKGRYHSLELNDGTVLPGLISVEALLARVRSFPIPEDLRGRRVLDVGAASGWNAFEMERRGAEVVAVDCVEYDELRAVAELRGSRIDYRLLDVDELDPESIGTFDYILFFGVLYHLRHPLLGLEKICALARDCVLIESYVADGSGERSDACTMEFYETDELGGQIDNWCGPTTKCLMAMCRSAGFAQVTLEYVGEGRAGITCRRRWEAPAANPSAAPPYLCSAVNNRTIQPTFHRAKDEYLCLYFRSRELLTRHDLRAEVDGFGVPALAVTRTGEQRDGTGEWQANLRLPPGLATGSREVRLRTVNSGFSNSLSISMTAEAGPGPGLPIDFPPLETATAPAPVLVAVENTFDGSAVFRGFKNEYLSVVFTTDETALRRDEVLLQVDGRDVPVHLLTNPGGVEWQVNAKLLADLSAGIHHARVRTARSPFCEAGEFRLEG